MIALVPAATIGSGLLAATTGTGAALGAVAGHVAAVTSRSDLKDLGEHLDEGQIGLVVVAAADVSSEVEVVLERADQVATKGSQASDTEINKEVAEAVSDAAS